MSVLCFLSSVLLVFLLFIPVWAGGQAMKCYNDGNTVRSALGVLLGVAFNVVIFAAGFAFAKSGYTIEALVQLIILWLE
jgi:uncharacterized membrane protein